MEYFDTYESPLGKIILTCDGTHLTAVFFEDQKHAESHLSAEAKQCIFPVLEETKDWLSRYFRGNIPEELPSIKLNGTPFQKRVWKLLMEIPYGKTVTYGALAKKLGCKSAQAVGGAVGKNPVSILVPCHRVVGAGGKITGYAGGIKKKAYLISLESKS